MDAHLSGSRSSSAGDDFEVDDGVWVLDLGGAEEALAPPGPVRGSDRVARPDHVARPGLGVRSDPGVWSDRPPRARTAVPIMARDAQVKVVDHVDARVSLDLAMRDVQRVKDEALSWLQALTRAM